MIASIEEEVVYYLVKIHNDLNPTVAYELEEILSALKEKDPKHTIFDMGDVSICSNSALGVLIEYAHYLLEVGKEVIFFCLAENLEKNFIYNNLIEDLIPRKKTKEDALKYIEEASKLDFIAKAKKTAKLKQIKLDESLKEISIKALSETKKIRSIAKNNDEILHQLEKTEGFFKSITEKTKIKKLSTAENYSSFDDEEMLQMMHGIFKNLENLNKKYEKIEGMLEKVIEHFHIS